MKAGKRDMSRIVNSMCDQLSDKYDNDPPGDIELSTLGILVGRALLQAVANRYCEDFDAVELSKTEAQFSTGVNAGLAEYAELYGVAIHKGGKTDCYHGRLN